MMIAKSDIHLNDGDALSNITDIVTFVLKKSLTSIHYLCCLSLTGRGRAGAFLQRSFGRQQCFTKIILYKLTIFYK